MKHPLLFVLLVLSVFSALHAQTAQQTNTFGVNIDTDAEANSFLTALARGTSISFSELAYLDGLGGNVQTLLDGKVSLTGNETIAGNKTLSGTTAMSGNLTVDTDVLHVDTTNNRVGVGTAAPTYQLEVRDSGTATGGIIVSTSSFVNIPNPGSMSEKIALNARGFNFTQDGATLSSGYQPDLGFGLANARAIGLGLKVNATGAAIAIEQGRIGVGTNIPREAIDVVGNIITAFSDTSRLGMQFADGSEYRNGFSFDTTTRATRVDALSADGSIITFRTGTVGTPSERMRITSDGKVGIGNTPTEALDVTGSIKASGKIASTKTDTTLAAAATSLVVTNSFVKLTGDAGGNTLGTITGGISGQTLTILFVDALVTITDTDAATADSVDLSAAFTSSARDTITLIHDGTKWIETSRSVN